MLSRLLSKSIPNRGPHVRGEKREKEGFSGVPLRLGSPGGRRWRRRVWKAQGRGQEGDGLPPAPLPTGAASILPAPREGGRRGPPGCVPPGPTAPAGWKSQFSEGRHMELIVQNVNW